MSKRKDADSIDSADLQARAQAAGGCDAHYRARPPGPYRVLGSRLGVATTLVCAGGPPQDFSPKTRPQDASLGSRLGVAITFGLSVLLPAPRAADVVGSKHYSDVLL